MNYSAKRAMLSVKIIIFDRMRKIHVSTTIGLISLLAACVLIAFSFTIPGAILALFAYFASIKEVSKYTSWYQFSVVFASSLVTGIALDLPVKGIPFMTIALFVAALVLFCVL
jgi:hypothetical protein